MTTNYQSITKLISPNDLPLGIGTYLGGFTSILDDICPRLFSPIERWIGDDINHGHK